MAHTSTPSSHSAASTGSRSPRLHGHVDLILIRHAESSNNVLFDAYRRQHGADVPESVYLQVEAQNRHPDCGLSPRGIEQLAYLSRYGWEDYFVKAGTFPACRVLASPMQRCLLTAQAVGQSLQSRMIGPISIHPGLFEEGGCYHTLPDGTLVGLPGASWSDIQQQFPDFLCPQGPTGGWYDRPHIESQLEFDARALAMVEWIWSMQQDAVRSGCQALVLVTHGNFMSAVLSTLFSGQPHQTLYKHCNTGHTHIELFSTEDRNVAVCQSVNKVTHLLTQRRLIGGDHSVDDRWIQQFMARR